MKLRYLAVDRILSKDSLTKSGSRLASMLKNKISEREELSTKESQKIEQLEKDILRDNVFRLVSIHTPIEECTPVKFDLVFDYENLNKVEDCDLTVSHILYLRNNYLSQLPLGHHCEVFVECEPNIPELFDTLPIDSYDSIKIGICNKTDWPTIKAELEESKRSFEKWKQENLKNKQTT